MRVGPALAPKELLDQVKSTFPDLAIQTLEKWIEESRQISRVTLNTIYRKIEEHGIGGRRAEFQRLLLDRTTGPIVYTDRHLEIRP